MNLRPVWLACALLAAPAAVPQSTPDAQTRTREYTAFLVEHLDQWTRDFPQAYTQALVRPPVDAALLSEAARDGAGSLRESVAALAANAPSSPGFATQVAQALKAAAPVNEALGRQRFPEAIENDWATIRTTLNSLAAIYKVPSLAVLEPPAPASANPGVAGQEGTLTAYVVDQSCAARGKGMWVNAQCVQKCVRDSDKVVLVTEQGKVIQIANQDRIEAETYGQKVAVTGKTEGDTITIATVRLL
jgi:hypothetical protein